MKTHTLVFNEILNNTEFSFAIEYTLFTKRFGCFLAFREEQPFPENTLTKYDDFYLFKTGDIDIDKYKSKIKFGPKKINKYPKIIDKKADFNEIISNMKLYKKDFVFYTGAGLSKAAGIMDSFELKDSLCLYNLSKLKEAIVKNPEKLKKAYVSFVNSLYFTNPTVGHRIIKTLQDKYDFLLLTENIDLLHQKTASKVYAYDKIKNTLLDNKKIMLTLGLDGDHQGFIRYVQNNNCLVIALNVNKPNYLKERDIWIKEDAHTFLKTLHEHSVGEQKVI